MNIRMALFPRQHACRRYLLLLAPTICTILFASCGTVPNAPPPVAGGTTRTVLLLTSAGGSEPFSFFIGHASLTLKDQAGNTVSVFNYPDCQNGAFSSQSCLWAEYMSVNGTASLPRLTVTLPQGTYISAALTVGPCEVQTLGANANGGSQSSSFYQGHCAQGTGNATVNLPSPLIVSGSSLALSLSLQVPKSYSLTGSGCVPGAGVYGGTCTATISPLFALSSFQIAASPTSSSDGLAQGISAQVQSVSTSGFTAVAAGYGTQTFDTDTTTEFLGVEGLSSLTTGETVQMDVAIRPDATLLARRVEAGDPTAPNWMGGVAVTSEIIGPSIMPGAFSFSPLSFLSSDNMWTGVGGLSGPGSTVFKVSGEFGNLGDLPFPATFNAQTMVGGQQIGVHFSADLTDSAYHGYAPVTTITLMPQTVSGTIASVSNSGGFTIYSVVLSPTDLIPSLQGIVGTYLRPANATNIVVYADRNTQTLSSQTLSVGSVRRFRGLLFDDNGTLRMDCGQILDGVPE